ncbi:protein translocase subunit TIM50 [Kluyveromyces lactis]|uniref:Mitochondrial import inner membrane translocase subunit TIM50 n=1 Tax=Kluyveromyces lactis (strain ATCC 8585 / CBS 2359 / DSM 70799 / NBRC 1267 / NRRL Y-1140 / WM37) TaxID=284590 RepID=TIM50_KLULA|nr:uncharacterized protein KLLA0_E23101g [Kluyveromyces lactis]Q6CM45.1 RecName: Full=Mitochondrial import inner membrane translocase subunit TIM50; Flags: Precursor [Kluyveromyces lactis NRRL Y-1140]CAH00081.1 KLLA0E23101p [Kluyveromyces lactis]|eukprot:XP_454994.1 uncharacterized protein KLLA0_E23101g [Kluyveromyces lactis]
MLSIARVSLLRNARMVPVHAMQMRPVVVRRSLHNGSLLLQKKNEKNEAPKSILDDDMLARAGVEVEGNEAGSKDKSGRAGEAGESAEQDDSTGDKGSGKKKRSRKSSTDIKRERYANWFYILSLLGLASGALSMARDWDSDESEELKKEIPNGYTPALMYKRMKRRWESIFTFFQEPPFPDLLPPPPPPPYQRPLTLVLSLEDLLVHSEWTQQSGWRTAKRPGVDYFLGYLSQYYEIVLFSSNYMMYAEKIAEKLDPIHAFITYNLFKEHCLYKDGVHIKDLSKLNRDLGKVLIIDTDENSFKLQPENAIYLEPWDGKADDRLLRLIPFLEYLATQQVSDVRPILKSFPDNKNIPEAFEKRVQVLKEKFERDERVKNDKNLFLKLLGIGLIGTKPKFPLDLIREEGEKNYVRFMKLVEEEKEKIKLQQQAMGQQTFTLKDYVEGNIPTPEEQLKLQMEKQQEIEAQFEEQKKLKAQQGSK